MKTTLTLTLLSFLVVVGCDNSFQAQIKIRNKNLLSDTVKIVYAGMNEMEVALPKPETILVKSTITNDSVLVRDLKTDFNFSYKSRDIGQLDTLLFIKDGSVIQKEIYLVKENPMSHTIMMHPF